MDVNKTQVPAPRIPLQMDVEFRRSYGRQAQDGTLKNISLTGAFLETSSRELGVKDKLVIELIVSDRRRKVMATVVWTNGLGCGLRFQPFNKRDVQLVDDLMYFVQNRRDTRRNLLDDIFKVAA